MILHFAELWLTLAVCFGFGAIVGSIVQRAIALTGARRAQAWMIRLIDRIVWMFERRIFRRDDLLPQRLPSPVVIPPPDFGHAPTMGGTGYRTIEPGRIEHDSSRRIDEIIQAPGKQNKKIRDALARADAVGVRPLPLHAPRSDRPDDIVAIKKIGKRNAARLATIGIFHYSQIAAWTPREAAWIGSFLDVGGAVYEQDWIGQATRLASSESFPVLRPEAETPATVEGVTDQPG